MTVNHLKTLRLVVFIAICTLPAAALLFISQPYWLYVLIALFLLYLIQRRLLSAMFRRLDYIYYELADPELLSAEAGAVYRLLRLPAIKRNTNIIHVYEARRCDLTGDYGKAIEEATSVAFDRAQMDEAMKWDLAYYYLRDGKLKMAESMLQSLGVAAQANAGPLRSHTLGLLRLEKGELEQAEKLLESALRRAERNLTKCKCLYELGRVREKMGDGEKAREYYSRAAEVGPKTWMGRMEK